MALALRRTPSRKTSATRPVVKATGCKKARKGAKKKAKGHKRSSKSKR